MGTYAFDKENTVKLTIKINKRTDADIIQHLQEIVNKQGYLKQLIRADIAREAQQDEQTDE
jgi:hypothetical protein